MLFIATTPGRKSVEEKRDLIRSHVMRGKNRKKTPSRPPSWINRSATKDNVRTESPRSLYIPCRVGGEFSFTPCSAEITPDMLGTIWQLKQAMFPIEVSGVSSDAESSWLAPIWNDVACLHFTIFIAKTYLNYIQNEQIGNDVALTHLIKALNVLQQRLAGAEAELATSDSTILVVFGLTVTATGLDDYEAAQNHIKGLHRMVALRGGMPAFKRDRLLQAKFCRADLTVTLATGSKPLFFGDSITWDSYSGTQKARPTSKGTYPSPHARLSASTLEIFLNSVDDRLRIVWNDLSEFTRATNIATQCERSLDSELYQEVMVSIHYRLVYLCFEEESKNEIFRLGLLAFVSHLFLQWCGVKIQFKHLAQCFAKAISRQEQARSLPTQLTLWIRIVGAISLFDQQEQALLQPSIPGLLREMNLRSWDEVRICLKCTVWIDAVQDAPAKRIVEAALA